MPRSLKAILVCVFLVSFLAIGFGAPPVRATTYELTAVSLLPAEMDGWKLRYGYVGPEPKLQSTTDVVSFTGFMYYNSTPDTWFDQVAWVPAHSASSPFTDGVDRSSWTFFSSTPGVPGVVDFSASLWTYSQAEVVPLPPSVFLLGAGLIGLAVARRKKRLGP